ncbi:unnamed protein product [Calypogeia fissa]
MLNFSKQQNGVRLHQFRALTNPQTGYWPGHQHDAVCRPTVVSTDEHPLFAFHSNLIKVGAPVKYGIQRSLALFTSRPRVFLGPWKLLPTQEIVLMASSEMVSTEEERLHQRNSNWTALPSKTDCEIDIRCM